MIAPRIDGLAHDGDGDDLLRAHAEPLRRQLRERRLIVKRHRKIFNPKQQAPPFRLKTPSLHEQNTKLQT